MEDSDDGAESCMLEALKVKAKINVLPLDDEISVESGKKLLAADGEILSETEKVEVGEEECERVEAIKDSLDVIEKMRVNRE